MPRVIATNLSRAYRHPLDDVHVVTDDASARARGAKAYTIGREMHFGPGQFAPGTESGDRLIAHEAAHVVQQTLGDAPGIARADGAAAERAADAAANDVVAGRGHPITTAVTRQVQRQAVDPRDNPDDFAPRVAFTDDEYVGMLQISDWSLYKVEEFGGLKTVETRFPKAFAIIKERVLARFDQKTWDLIYTNDHRIIKLVRNAERIKARIGELLTHYEKTGQRAAAEFVTEQWDEYNWEYVDIAGYMVENDGALGWVETALDRDWIEITDSLELEAEAEQAALIALEADRARWKEIGEELLDTHVATIEEWGSDTQLDLEKLLHPPWGTEDYFQGLAWARNSGRASAVIRRKDRFYIYELDDQFDTGDVFLIDDWIEARSEIVDTSDTPTGTTLVTSDGNFLHRPSGYQRFFGGRTAEIAEDLERADQALVESADPELDTMRLFEALLMDVLLRNLGESERSLWSERDRVIDPNSFPQMPIEEGGAALQQDAAALKRHMAWAARLADEIGDDDPTELQRREVELALAAIGRIHRENPAAAFLVHTERNVLPLDWYREFIISKGGEIVGDTAFMDLSASMTPKQVCWKVAGELDRRINNVRKIRKHFLNNPHDVLDLEPLHGEVLERFSESDQSSIEWDLFFRDFENLVSSLGMAALEIGLMILGMATSGLTSFIALGISAGIGIVQTKEAFEQAERLEAMSALDFEGGFQLATPDQASSAKFWAYVSLGLTLVDLGGLALSVRQAARLRRVIADPDVAAVLKRSDQDLGDLAKRMNMSEKQLVDRLRWARGTDRDELLSSLRKVAQPHHAGGRAGHQFDWPTRYSPKQVEDLREGLLELADEPDVFRHVEKSARERGMTLDLTEEDLYAIKAYLFDNPGVAFSQANYNAWRRLAKGVGSLEDLRLLQHEAREIAAIRRLDPKFDLDVSDWANWSTGKRQSWTKKFEKLYDQAHAEALEHEYRLAAEQIRSATGVDVSPNAVAVADMLSPTRAPGRPEQYLKPDGMPLFDHPDFPTWHARAREPVDLPDDIAQPLGLTPAQLGRSPTLTDVLVAVRRQALDPQRAARVSPKWTLHHGTSWGPGFDIRHGVRIDVNAAHPGRQHFGPGFYLGDVPAAEYYARQAGQEADKLATTAAGGVKTRAPTGAPTLVTFRDVPLDDLGTVLDLTQGRGATLWDGYLDEILVGTHKRRDLWHINLEGRGQMVEDFLKRERLAPDVIIAPHPPGTTPQIVIRTQQAADVLNLYLEGATKVTP